MTHHPSNAEYDPIRACATTAARRQIRLGASTHWERLTTRAAFDCGEHFPALASGQYPMRHRMIPIGSISAGIGVPVLS